MVYGLLYQSARFLKYEKSFWIFLAWASRVYLRNPILIVIRKAVWWSYCGHATKHFLWEAIETTLGKEIPHELILPQCIQSLSMEEMWWTLRSAFLQCLWCISKILPVQTSALASFLKNCWMYGPHRHHISSERRTTFLNCYIHFVLCTSFEILYTCCH